jgi:hypothetical protein
MEFLKKPENSPVRFHYLFFMKTFALLLFITAEAIIGAALTVFHLRLKLGTARNAVDEVLCSMWQLITLCTLEPKGILQTVFLSIYYLILCM